MFLFFDRWGLYLRMVTPSHGDGFCGNLMRSGPWPVRRERDSLTAKRCIERGHASNANVLCFYPCYNLGGLD
jgi:hypothetical protein